MLKLEKFVVSSSQLNVTSSQLYSIKLSRHSVLSWEFFTVISLFSSLVSHFLRNYNKIDFFKGISAAFATLIFGLWANQDKWMPGHDNNFFGWSFGVAIASVFALIAAGILFLVEARIQNRKKKYHEEAQRRFERNQETRT